MNDLIEYLEEMTPRKVDKDKLYAYLYENKISPDTLWYKLINASKLVRQNYLIEFEKYSIWL